jgi:DNA-binding NarL/FixJ family response regulator
MARLEFGAARQAFQQLGAAPDLRRTLDLERRKPGTAGLTLREVEVLRLVAAGMTNPAIASELGVTNHTVRRHLQNIFTKLDVPSRAAAATIALRQRLI